jgi:hypothetical protein
MRQFKFFSGFIDDTITYWSADPILNNSNYGTYWSNEDPEEIRRQQRIQQQREQTNRMRNFGYNNRYRTRLIGPR